jgi:hypothetical protein
MSDDPRKRGGIFAAHAELIGRVTLMWSDVHAQVGQLFEDCCASEERENDIGKLNRTAHNGNCFCLSVPLPCKIILTCASDLKKRWSRSTA